MTGIFRKMREQRLRYAIARETDRQSVTLRQATIDEMVAHAMAAIDLNFQDEEDRMEQAELAERTLQPVIAALSEASQSETSNTQFSGLVGSVKDGCFPWTSPLGPSMQS